MRSGSQTPTGSGAQPLDSDLSLYAAITPSANVQSVLGAADYSAIRTLLSLVVGTNVQGYSAQLAALASLPPVYPALTPGAEAANAIAVAIQLKNVAGTNVSRINRLTCEVLDADYKQIDAAATVTLAETGAGAEVSTTAKAALVIDTDANGAATVTITDATAAYVGTYYLRVTPVCGSGAAPGFPCVVAVVFA